MRISKKNVVKIVLAVAILTVMSAMTVFAAEEVAEYVPSMYGTFWALIPPLVAIVLALITKEVYSSLFVGIVMGAMLYSFPFTSFKSIVAAFQGGDFFKKLLGMFEGTVTHVINDGFIAVLSDSYNVGILVFLVVLGAIVVLMNRAGGSAAFGNWASKHIKSRVGAQLVTILLGVMIFIDDYFNCLTVGSVMRPVTDKHKISRAKLSYIIDATAAPVCIIAPVSSWAAAVSSYVEEGKGLEVFIKAIPYNFYALFTILMMIVLVISKKDYGPMKKHEINAMNGDLYTTPDRPYANAESEQVNAKGKVIDLVFPIIVLIISCVIGMIYTGGFFSGENFIEAFSNCDASVGLAIGSVISLIITIIFYLLRRVLSFKDCMEGIPEGFKAMVPAILILTFAWTLKAMTDSLGATEFVDVTVKSFADGLMGFLPAIIFVIGCVISFATGTSWGTFGILIPIVIAVFGGSDPQLMIIGISACMAGAVCGDHCSPISDTTIMASAGGQCNHVNHVSTQLPYALTIAAVSFVTYIIAGFVKSAWIALPIGAVLTVAVVLLMCMLWNGKKEKVQSK